jgi:hypothetical protein
MDREPLLHRSIKAMGIRGWASKELKILNIESLNIESNPLNQILSASVSPRLRVFSWLLTPLARRRSPN